MPNRGRDLGVNLQTRPEMTSAGVDLALAPGVTVRRDALRCPTSSASPRALASMTRPAPETVSRRGPASGCADGNEHSPHSQVGHGPQRSSGCTLPTDRGQVRMMPVRRWRSIQHATHTRGRLHSRGSDRGSDFAMRGYQRRGGGLHARSEREGAQRDRGVRDRPPLSTGAVDHQAASRSSEVAG